MVLPGQRMSDIDPIEYYCLAAGYIIACIFLCVLFLVYQCIRIIVTPIMAVVSCFRKGK